MENIEQQEAQITEKKRSGGILSGAVKIFTVVMIAMTVFSMDQLTKWLIRENLLIGESWPSEGFFRLTHSTNTGTAFGLFQQHTAILTVASIAAIGIIIYFYRAHSQSNPLSILTVGLLLGGAFGNLLDRLAAGRVTDFIDVGPWPNFNIADSAIVVGIFILIAGYILQGDSSKESDADRQPES